MNIQTKQVNLRILQAEEGMVLTNGEAFSSVGGCVYLAETDSPENWQEITPAEYEVRKQEAEKPLLMA